MFGRFIASMMFAALVSGTALAADLGDIGLEVLTKNVDLPAQDRGSITIKQCSSCTERELLVTPATSYEIGDVQVRRETLRQELLARPNQVMLVQLTPDRKHVARLKLGASVQ